MSKLFCDCKTDEEKSNFFLSGQGVETWIIAPAISNEVAMAFHRCFEFEKQLAAAIAACKLKDEALQNCEGMLDELRDYPITHDAIIEALTIQPDDSALKTWIGEPAGYKRLWALNGEVPAKERRENGRLAWPYKFKLLPVTEGKCLPDDVPLYSPKGLK